MITVESTADTSQSHFTVSLAVMSLLVRGRTKYALPLRGISGGIVWLEAVQFVVAQYPISEISEFQFWRWKERRFVRLARHGLI